ncbi:hypothetical protein COOONC_14694 [Cooperia oncophora]
MDFVTVCDRPFYGIMCARQCFEKHGANYICDPRGEKVCLVGWTGKDCDIAITDVPLGKSPELSSSTLLPASTSTGRDHHQANNVRLCAYRIHNNITSPSQSVTPIRDQ